MRKVINGRSTLGVLVAVSAWAITLCPSLASATTILGTAQDFAVLGHETVTNGHSDPNPTTVIFGNLGVTPGTAITGFYPDGTVNGGVIHVNDGPAQNALADATTAYNTLASLPFDFDFTGIDLGSAGYTVLTPGVYHFASTALLSGALTLDFLGNPDSEFIFQIGSALTTASSSSVNVINGGGLSGVYWQVGSSATLGSDTVFAGNILALTSISLDPRASILCGRAIALTGAVTLIDNFITNNNTLEDFGSDRPDFGSFGYSGGSGGDQAPIPEPATLTLLGLGLAGLVVRRIGALKA